jgi:protein ImuB
MSFASIYVPDFSIQAVVRTEPPPQHAQVRRASPEPVLRQQAVALIEGHAPLEKVVAINQAAAQAGIALGMTKSQVQQFPSAAIRLRSRAQEEIAHAALLDLGWSVSPHIEDTAPDSIVVDLAGLAALFGSEEVIARLLLQRACDLGLLVHVAVSSNLEVALHAARGFRGITMIPAGKESARLGALPIQIFSPPVEIIETLDRWGICTCADLAKLPLLELSERLGQQGVQLHQWARGASVRSMILAEPQLRFEEEMELEYAIEELEPLAFLLARLLDQLCARLSARCLSASAIRVRFKLDTCSQGESMHPPQNANIDAKKIYEKTLTLPVPMRDPKMLLKLLRLHLRSDLPTAAIVHICIAAEAEPPRLRQEGLFLPSAPDPAKLELTIARLADLVGKSNIGSPRLIDSHRPDAFEMGRFVPAQNARNIENNIGSPAERESIAAFRVFRPAPRAKVSVREGCPAHISFPNTHGKVTIASGPWRTSGEWWSEDAWDRQEWDIEVQPSVATNAIKNSSSAEPGKSVYRIYFDALQQAWFVAGMYD